MKKIFEIPIYAFKRNVLQQRYKRFEQNFRNMFSDLGSSEEAIRMCIDIESFPKRVWDYNHIIGFIVIGLEHGDIGFKIYLPWKQKSRYMWKSLKKVFLYDIYANETFFRVEDKQSNEEIQEQVEESLVSIINHHIPDRYYVDTETFYRMNKAIDYKKVIDESQLNMLRNNGKE